MNDLFVKIDCGHDNKLSFAELYEHMNLLPHYVLHTIDPEHSRHLKDHAHFHNHSGFVSDAFKPKKF